MLRVTYVLTRAGHADVEANARFIAREQSVEASEGTAPAVEARLVGRVESTGPAGDGRWRTVIAYRPQLQGGDVTQMFNLLTGASVLRHPDVEVATRRVVEALRRYGT